METNKIKELYSICNKAEKLENAAKNIEKNKKYAKCIFEQSEDLQFAIMNATELLRYYYYSERLIKIAEFVKKELTEEVERLNKEIEEA